MFPGEYCYVRDVIGDGESGDVIYCCAGETWRAPYEIGMMNGKRTCAIDDDQALNVVPRTVYDEEADESDHYAGMTDTETQEAKAMPSWMRRMVLTERFVSKAERDAADSGDFAGKGKSFPILKPGDVMAAVRSMGRAGSDNKGTAALKASIIRIAKKKGWAKYLPKAWQSVQSDTGASESTASEVVPRGTLVLQESAEAAEAIVLTEARSDYPVRLISAGKGSTAWYPKEVLQRDGPKVFKAGMHMYVNHPTAAEEAARPEGNWEKLAAVLTEDARWDDNGPKGPALYSRMKVFSDHGTAVEEKAPYTGVSIRANGNAVMEGRNAVMKEGVPLLAALTSAASVDIVTHAGARGMILTESAVNANQQEVVDMTPEEIKKLVESAVATAVAAVSAPVQGLTQRALRGDAMVEANRILKTVSLGEISKQRIVEAALREIPQKDGELDGEKFSELVIAEAKREGAYVAQLTGSGRVTGMGEGIGLVPDKAERKRLKEAEKAERKAGKRSLKEAARAWEEIGLDPKAAERAAEGRVA